MSTVTQLKYEDRIIPSSLSSKRITTTDVISARHHAFWWENEVQAPRVDGTVSQNDGQSTVTEISDVRESWEHQGNGL
jgi:hypothetical protein